MTGNPCLPPCWQGLIPGQSSEEEVWEGLRVSTVVDPGTPERIVTVRGGVPVIVMQWEDRGRRPREVVPGATNEIYVRDGKLLLVRIYLDYDLAFSTIVDQFGPPDGIYASAVGSEKSRLNITLDYPSQGFLVRGLGSSTSDPELERKRVEIVTEDTMVATVCYFAPTSLNTALTDVVFPDEDSRIIKQMLADEQPWQGFGAEVPLAVYGRAY